MHVTSVFGLRRSMIRGKSYALPVYLRQPEKRVQIGIQQIVKVAQMEPSQRVGERLGEELEFAATYEGKACQHQEDMRKTVAENLPFLSYKW
jgi:ribosomal protein S7